MGNLRTSTVHIQLLNCAKGKDTTIINIRTFSQQLDCIIFILQEPWLEREGQPPTHPDFDLYTPTPIKPLYATYIRRGYNIVASTEFTHGRSFLGSYIIINNSLSFYLYNFYSPGYPKAFADLCKSFTPKSPCILMRDLNAHHPLWYSHGGGIPNKDVRRNTLSNSIAEWFEKFSFLLHNEPGVYTHFPRAESFNPSVLDLCLSRGGIMQRIETWTIDRNSGSDHAIVGL
jgi:hypothetical protein